MASDKSSARVAAVKCAKTNGDYSLVTLFFRGILSKGDIDTVREQKLLLGLPQLVFDECIGLFCDAAKRVLDQQDATFVTNYALFLRQVSGIRERIDQKFRAGLCDVSTFTLGDLTVALDTWLKESFDHISIQAWENFKSTLNLVKPSIPMQAALSEETYQSIVANTNEILFAGARLLNEAAAILRCSQQSNIGSRGRGRLREAIPPLISLAHEWNGIQDTLDKISYGEWRVESITSHECKIGLVDSRLEISRVLALRREAIQRMQRSRSPYVDSTYIGKQLGDLLPPFLDALLDDVPASYELTLTTPEYWDLRNRLRCRLSDIGAEDDLLLLASRDDSPLVVNDYIACAMLRWHQEVSEWVLSRVSKRRQRAAERSAPSITSLINLLPVSAENRSNVRRSLKEFCGPIPRKIFYSMLDYPFLLLDDESLATIPALDGGQWTATVRSKWVRKGNIGHRYGRAWEEYLIWLLGRSEWTVLGKNINLRHTQKGNCEIDLLIGRDDVCLVVQVKAFAGQGMNMYDHWKNRQTIEKGVFQAKLAVELLTSAYRLSDLVGKNGAKSIKVLRPLVLSTLHYFNGWQSEDVSVLSVSALENLMRGARVEFRNSSGKIAYESGEKRDGQLTGAELLDFLDNPVDWRISQGTAVLNKKSVMIEEIEWSIPCIGTDGDPFEAHPEG